jgi:hypothetical protein
MKKDCGLRTKIIQGDGTAEKLKSALYLVAVLCAATAAVVCVFGFSFFGGKTLVADANSALMYKEAEIEGYNLLPLYDSELSITHENLIFDFSDNLYDETYGGLIGSVFAGYDIFNAGDEKNVTLGFPLVSSLEALKEHNYAVSVSVNDKVIPAATYLLDEVKSDLSETTFENVLAQYNSMSRLSGDTPITAYTVDLSQLAPDAQAQLDFKMNKWNSYAYYDGFWGDDSFSDKNGVKQISLHARIYDENRVATLYALGDGATDLALYACDENGDRGEALPARLISQVTITANQFINSVFAEEGETLDASVAELYLYYLKKAVSGVAYAESVQSLEGSVMYSQRTVLASFDATFVSGANSVYVVYTLDTGYDADYNPSVYECVYISNPAKNWSSFGGITVKVLTSEDNPYVVFDNISFTKTGDYEYTFISSELPRDNIAFGLCASDNPSRGGGYLWILILIPAVLLGIPLLLGATFLTLYLVDRKHNKKAAAAK